MISGTLAGVEFGLTPMTEAWFLTVWENADTRLIVFALLSPTYLAVLLQLFWLQKLLYEFQQGAFFSSLSIRCYQWMAWLQVFRFAYDIVWIFLAAWILDIDANAVVDLIDLLPLILLVFIARVLMLAKELQEENKEFV